MTNRILLPLLSFLIVHHVNAQKSPIVNLKWIDNNPISESVGVSWGIPFARGIVNKSQSFTLTNGEGKTMPLQTWSTAYWPDGSIKWSGFATVAGTRDGTLTLSAGNAKTNLPTSALLVKENSETISINTGELKCVVRKSGGFIIDSLIVAGNLVGSKARLECILQNGADNEDYGFTTTEKFTSNINKVTLEQNGAIRSVVRIQGILQSDKGGRQLLPFNMRMYFYAGSKEVRLVNTILYDGDQFKDLIKGLGLLFSVPMREQLFNRHVRFGGEGNGIWAEPVKPLYNKGNVDTNQLAGKAINPDNPQARSQSLVRTAIWNDFKLVQGNADGFNIQKRTNTRSAWIDVSAGRRANGYVFVGDTRGGLGIGLKDFWQSYPSALEVRNAETKEAELRV